MTETIITHEDGCPLFFVETYEDGGAFIVVDTMDGRVYLTDDKRRELIEALGGKPIDI